MDRALLTEDIFVLSSALKVPWKVTIWGKAYESISISVFTMGNTGRFEEILGLTLVSSLDTELSFNWFYS